jgi:LPXTG-motif cell wall-anchored protein
MSTNQISSITLFAIGAILLGLAYRASSAPLEQLSNAVTGHFSEQTAWFFVLGIAALGGGLFIALTKRS